MFDKWLPNFSSNNIITIEDHVTCLYDALGAHAPNQHQYVSMKFFSISLEDNARYWFNSFPTNNIRTRISFHEASMKIWAIRKDDIRAMLTQFHEIKNKDNEIVRDFDERFRNLVKKIPDDLKPRDGAILLQYTNAFNG